MKLHNHAVWCIAVLVFKNKTRILFSKHRWSSKVYFYSTRSYELFIYTLILLIPLSLMSSPIENVCVTSFSTSTERNYLSMMIEAKIFLWELKAKNLSPNCYAWYSSETQFALPIKKRLSTKCCSMKCSFLINPTLDKQV